MASFPYLEEFGVNRSLPTKGVAKEQLLDQLAFMAHSEDPAWETGKCSGTMYCGDHQHYELLNEAFSLFSHVNALQRDLCPSSTKFESEIISMTLNLFGADAVTDSEPVGLLTSGGSGSIAHAVLAYRDAAGATNGRPNFIKPETAHPAFDKACHLFGVELRVAPIDPVTTQVDVAAVAKLIDENTIAVVGSACNYGYGTIDPITELGELTQERAIGLHVDGCLGGFLLPFGRELGYDIAPFDFTVPGVTSISADTHKYGYGLKGTSVLCFRDRSLRNAQYFFQTEWTGGKYCSPGMDGSRSGGLLAATWASMMSLGHEGYLKYAEAIFSTSARMQDAVRSHGELRIMGHPSFLFSFTSDEFDIYLVNDFLRTRGWRLNGQQYPNALHMAVTRPQTKPGVADAWAVDLSDAVQYARDHAAESAKSGAIYGGVTGGMTDQADAAIRSVLTKVMDRQLAIPKDL